MNVNLSRDFYNLSRDFYFTLDYSLVPVAYNLADSRSEWEYATVSNWDGEGALPLTSDVIARAQRILNAGNPRPPDEVSPGIDGSISFVWRSSVGYVYLDIGPNDTIHLYYDGRNGKWEGVSIEGETELENHLRKAFDSLDAAPSVPQILNPSMPIEFLIRHSRREPTVSLTASDEVRDRISSRYIQFDSPVQDSGMHSIPAGIGLLDYAVLAGVSGHER